MEGITPKKLANITGGGLLLSCLLPGSTRDIFPLIMGYFLPGAKRGLPPRQDPGNGDKDKAFPSPSHPSVLPWIHLICDELSDSDKGVGK